jgi:hypothetical protein
MLGCEHPEELRRPIPGYESDDPNEWECGRCGTWQLRDPMAAHGVGSELHVHHEDTEHPIFPLGSGRHRHIGGRRRP